MLATARPAEAILPPDSAPPASARLRPGLFTVEFHGILLLDLELHPPSRRPVDLAPFEREFLEQEGFQRRSAGGSHLSGAFPAPVRRRRLFFRLLLPIFGRRFSMPTALRWRSPEAGNVFDPELGRAAQGPLPGRRPHVTRWSF